MGNYFISVSNGSGRVARDVINCHKSPFPENIPNKSGVENQENSPSFLQEPVIVCQKPCSAVAGGRKVQKFQSIGSQRFPT
jgi:hypothetical protein